MTYDEFCNAVEEAQVIEDRAKAAVRRLARMCRERLRLSDVDTYTLSALKRELRDWDMVRSEWRNK
jgi:hypothetical protein